MILRSPWGQGGNVRTGITSTSPFFKGAKQFQLSITIHSTLSCILLYEKCFLNGVWLIDWLIDTHHIKERLISSWPKIEAVRSYKALVTCTFSLFHDPWTILKNESVSFSEIHFFCLWPRTWSITHTSACHVGLSCFHHSEPEPVNTLNYCRVI